jgi:hypothetical protein
MEAKQDSMLLYGDLGSFFFWVRHAFNKPENIYSNKSVVSVSSITENACVYTLESINIPFVGEREFSSYIVVVIVEGPIVVISIL